MSENCNIQVLIRVRPLNSREIQLNAKSCVQNDKINNQKLTLNANNEQKFFAFDHIFDESSTQQDIFQRLGQNFTDSFLQGYNVCIFAYGQTGAGKTYTMQGAGLEFNSEVDTIHQGLQPRVLEYIFNTLQSEQNQYLIRCSYLEIYNEQIMDLVGTPIYLGNNLHIREDIQRGVYIEGLCEQVAQQFQDTLTLLRNGARNRHVGATSMNFESSRSHSLFTISLQTRQQEGTVQSVQSSHLHFVDLAGSERQTLTGAKGDRLKEAGNINKSLTILGCVINNLVEISNGKARHVPYRDSKLTFILKDSLGGNSRTAIIAAISSANTSFQETLCTLQFAQRAKMIKNKATINEQSSGSVQSLQQEIKKLRNELALTKQQLIRYENLDIMKSIKKKDGGKRKSEMQIDDEEEMGAKDRHLEDEEDLLAFPDDESFDRNQIRTNKNIDMKKIELEKLDLVNKISVYQSVVRQLQGMCDQLALSEGNQKIISQFLIYKIENQNKKMQSYQQESDTTQLPHNDCRSNGSQSSSVLDRTGRQSFPTDLDEGLSHLGQVQDGEEVPQEFQGEDEQENLLLNEDEENHMQEESTKTKKVDQTPQSNIRKHPKPVNLSLKFGNFESVQFDQISLNEIQVCIQNSRSQLTQFKKKIESQLQDSVSLRQSWRTPEKFREIDHMMSEIYTEFKGRSQNYQLDLQQTLEREKYLENEMKKLSEKYNKLINNFETLNQQRNQEMKKLHVQYQKLKFDLMNLSRDQEQSAHDVTELEQQNFALQNALQKANAQISMLNEEIVLVSSKENLRECEINQQIAKIMQELNMQQLQLEKASVTQMNLLLDSEQFKQENSHLLQQLSLEEQLNNEFKEKLTHSQASFQALKYSNENLENKLAEIEDEGARLKQENQSLGDSNSYLQSQIDEQQKRIEELVLTSDQLLNQKFHLEESLNARNDEFEALQRQIQNIDDDNNPLSKFIQQCRQMETKNQELHMTVQYYHRQNSEMKNSLYQLSERINQLHISENHFKVAFEDMRGRYQQKEGQQRTLREKIEIFEKQNKKLKEQNEKISHKFNKDRDELNNRDILIKKLEENILRKSDQQSKSVGVLEKLNKKCEELEKVHQNDLRTYLNLKETTSKLLTVYNQNMTQFQNVQMISEARDVQFEKIYKELREMKLKNSDYKNQLQQEIYVGKKQSQKLQKYHDKLIEKQKLIKHQHFLVEAFQDDIDNLENRIEDLFQYIEQCELACVYVTDRQDEFLKLSDWEMNQKLREENAFYQYQEVSQKNKSLESMVANQIQTIEQLRLMIEKQDNDMKEMSLVIMQKDRKINQFEKLRNSNLHEVQRMFQVEKYNLRLKELEENERHFNFEIQKQFKEMEKTIVCMETKYLFIKDASDRILSAYEVFRTQEHFNKSDQLFVKEVIKTLALNIKKAAEIDTTKPPNFDIMKKLNETKWSHFQKMFISQVCKQTYEMNVTLKIEENYCSDKITQSNLQFLINNLNVCHPDIQFYLNSFLLEEMNQTEAPKHKEGSKFSSIPVETGSMMSNSAIETNK